MTEQRYNWKRFWCLREGSFKLTAKYGYLADPEGPYGTIINPQAKTLEELIDVPCLVLLGEPGVGKSEQIEAQSQLQAKNQDTYGAVVLKYELRDFQTDLKLCQDIFDNNTRFQQWISGCHRLYLFLDSLDEGLLSINSLATLLIREFKKYPSERLFLRITCRTAEWPDILEQGLKQHWGTDAVEVYELLPLRKADVAEAARVGQVNVPTFLQAVQEKGVEPLAIKPVTLKFLLNTYRKHGRLPQTQTELYLQGCQYLCEETNKSRWASRRKGSLNPEQRLALASRIAAVCMLANRSTVWTDVNCGEVPEGDIQVNDLCGGTEGVSSARFHVGEAEIREALNTGLFSSRGPNRIGWAHQTYAEFLAAHYLTRHRMSVTQKLSLVIYPGDQQVKVIPQLQETASWLAGMDIQVFREIMKTDPAVLLRSDVATADDQDKAALVNSLLQSADNQQWVDRGWVLYSYYTKLKHPALAEQLKPYIVDKHRNSMARRVAMDVAEACQVQALQGELAGAALDLENDISLRVNAAYAVVRIGDSVARSMLKPLAFGNAGDDPEDELKGCGLSALWPDHLSPSELFKLVTLPKRQNFYGAYQSFINGKFAQHLQPSHLAKALRWVRTTGIKSDSSSPLSTVRKAILRQAWENIGSPGVITEIANVIADNLRDYQEELIESAEINDDMRRGIIGALLPFLSNCNDHSYRLVHGRSPLVVSSDMPWLLERLLEEVSPETQKTLAEIISNLFDHRDVRYVDQILTASKSCPVLYKQFAWWLSPVELDSPEAVQSRTRFEESRRLGQRNNKRRLLDPVPAERVSSMLDRFESGDAEAWWRLNLEMTLEPDSSHYGDEFQSEIIQLPGWKAATAETKSRIVAAAKIYLSSGEPEPVKWLGKKLLYRPAYAGYRALRLLSTESPESLTTLPAECWQKWASTVVAYPAGNRDEDTEFHARLIESAYKHAHTETISTVMKLIERENKESGHLFVLPALKYCWDDDLIKTLTDKLSDRRLKPECMGQILSELLSRDVQGAKKYAESLITKKHRSVSSATKSFVAARHLLIHASNATWPIVWPRIEQDTKFGRKLIESVAGNVYRRDRPILNVLTEDQLVQLFLWLSRQYPYKEDPRYDGVYSPSAQDHARKFRDATLNTLKERGTYESVAAMTQLTIKLPELEWLKGALVEAQEAARRRTWTPLQPSTILEIASSEQLQLVQNGSQLLDVLIESLKRLETKLRGETPAAIDLWNEIKPGVYRPKDENRFSDYIKRHLDEDLKQRGVIANREVEIRRGEGSFKGQRTDIHVDAVLKGPYNDSYTQLTAIIETKGCWNPELNQAMETQLKNRYLKDNQCQYGLYLVGWFNCRQWDKCDPRMRNAPKISKEEAQKVFNDQASSLSVRGAFLKTFVLDAALPS